MTQHFFGAKRYDRKMSLIALKHVLKVSIPHAVIIFMLVPFRFVLKRLGYFKKSVNSSFPKSHYYASANTLDIIMGLHKIPSNQDWLESKAANASVKNGELVPWITYPALHFLNKVQVSDRVIVEFGSGASTEYFIRRGAKVVSYEFDKDYFNLIRKLTLNPNLQIVDASEFVPVSGSDGTPKVLFEMIEHDKSYSGLNAEFWSNFSIKAYLSVFSEMISSADIIFVDGGPRCFVIGVASLFMNRDAILIIDNSDTKYVQESFTCLKNHGFIEVPFYGFGPLNPFEWGTSVFIKSIDPLKHL